MLVSAGPNITRPTLEYSTLLLLFIIKYRKLRHVPVSPALQLHENM